MGQRKLSCRRIALSAGLVLHLAASPAGLLAQGPVYRERWGYLYLEQRRAEVWNALRGRDAAVRAKVAEVLARPTLGSPFDAPAQALALLRGVPADAAFLLRASIAVFPLPEVCDPEANNEVCRNFNVSVFLPFSLELPGKVAFQVEVRDSAGVLRYTHQLTENTELADLRMARAAIEIPGAEFADGSYELRVATLVDEQPPRATDPTLRVPFHVLRGYQERSEAAASKVRELQPRLAPLPRALLGGLAAEVSRAYLGEAFDVASTAVLDLERLEQAIANVVAERHVLHGLTGAIATALPGQGRDLGCVLQLSPDRHPAGSPPARPLLVFAGGSPTYGIDAVRPAAPTTRGPRWLAAQLRDLPRELPYDVVCLESPGSGREYAADLGLALPALRELWGATAQPLVVVAEREAAAILGLQLSRLQPQFQGLVLLGAGAMPVPALDRIGKLPVRLGLVQGLRSSDGLQRVLDYADRLAASGQLRPDIQRLEGEQPAWLFSLPTYLPAIAQFAMTLAPPQGR